MSTDLHDLLRSAADGLDPEAPDVSAMSGRIRRRRAVRAGATTAGVLALAGALAITAAELGGVQHRDEPAVQPSAVTLPTAVAGAEPGTCGWEVGAAGADGLAVDGSDATYQLGVQSARPSDPPDTAVRVETQLFGTAATLPRGLGSTYPTAMLTRDGVVVARAQMDAGALGETSPATDHGGAISYGFPLAPVTCGATSSPLPDGTYQLWAVQGVEMGDGERTLLLGGGGDVHVAAGSAATTCGTPVGDLPGSAPGVDVTVHVYYGDLPADLFPDVTNDRSWLAASVSVAPDQEQSVAGSYSGTVYLADASGRIVADGTDPTLGQVVGLYPIGAAGGSNLVTTPQLSNRCDDGKKLAPGTYRSFVVLELDRAGGAPGIEHLVAEGAPVVVGAS
ncbi:hypothetical protein IC607_12415 [Cellulomonas sp. JH27-2]|uniref:hypothetical protein n=1 Tax=Cellulomonas sp. JH27-2 TaxID=2774139 RepID=UPI00177FA879|nr:hypothetical protein [Cellulomonas sp. JH27-2]MBD8059771.1 hypothetical protein [Cellulomonas sp. JH27-2]